MKQLLILLVSLTYGICSGAQINAGTIIRTREVPGKDSVVYYETDIATRQKSFMDLLVGTWTLTKMKKQSQMDADYLKGIILTLNKDSSFIGQASCNKISGKFSIKGTSIKFNDIVSTKMSCDRQDEEAWILQLLQGTVSNYTVTKPNLLLRDVSGNIVFEADRKNSGQP